MGLTVLLRSVSPLLYFPLKHFWKPKKATTISSWALCNTTKIYFEAEHCACKDGY